MTLLIWNDNYSVGIREIDSQHKNIIVLINKLFDEMNVGRGKEAVGVILDELVKYTVYHFSFEESLLVKHSYPKTRAHAKSHNIFIDQLKEFMKDYQSGKDELPNKLLEFLKEWLINHISFEDKEYSFHLKSKGMN